MMDLLREVNAIMVQALMRCMTNCESTQRMLRPPEEVSERLQTRLALACIVKLSLWNGLRVHCQGEILQ